MRWASRSRSVIFSPAGSLKGLSEPGVAGGSPPMPPKRRRLLNAKPIKDIAWRPTLSSSSSRPVANAIDIGQSRQRIHQRVAGEDRRASQLGEDRLGPAAREEVAVLVSVAAALGAAG